MDQQLANMLTRRNRMLEDVIFEATSEQTTDTYRALKSIPQLTKTDIAEGAPIVRTGQELIREPTSAWKAYSEVPVDLLMLSDNPDRLRTDEDNGVLQGASQQIASLLLYSSRATQGEDGIDGFATRLNELSQLGTFSAGGAGTSLSSLYIVVWSRMFGACLIYPKNIPFAGIRAENKGEYRVLDDNGGYYEVMHTKFSIYWGMEIREPRNVFRYCNIQTDGLANSFDADHMIALLEEMQSTEGATIYANRRLKAQVNIQAANKPNVEYSSMEVFGVPTRHFQGVPIKLSEAIVNGEMAVA